MSSITLKEFLNPERTPEQIAAGTGASADYIKWVRLEQGKETKVITAYHSYLVPAVAGPTSLYAAAINLSPTNKAPDDALRQHIRLRQERYEGLVERGVRLNIFLADSVWTNMGSIDEAARGSQLKRLAAIDRAQREDPNSPVRLKYVPFDPNIDSLRWPQGRDPILILGNDPEHPLQEPGAAYLESTWGPGKLVTDPGELRIMASKLSGFLEGTLQDPFNS